MHELQKDAAIDRVSFLDYTPRAEVRKMVPVVLRLQWCGTTKAPNCREGISSYGISDRCRGH